MTRINPDKHPNLAPLQSLCDQQRAIAVMKRYGCYVVPMEFDGQFLWRLRDKDGYDFPLAWSLELDNRGDFATPEAALLAAGECLDSQHKNTDWSHMNINQRIEQALADLINLVRSVESDEGEACGSMECDVDVTTQSGKVETWTVTVMRRADDEDDGESIAYRRGRMARARGSFRVLADPADDQERDEWLRGWDDEDSEIRWAERLLQRRKEGR